VYYYYDAESRRQHCREHIAQMREQYQRAQAAPRHDAQLSQSMSIAQHARSKWRWMRRRPAHRAPAYRA
jgi:hypothetical protein